MDVLKAWNAKTPKQKRQLAIGAVLGVLVVAFLYLSGPVKKGGEALPPPLPEETAKVTGGSVGEFVPLDTSSPIVSRANMAYALSLVYTYTPESARERFADFIRYYVDPNQREIVRASIDRRLTNILDSNSAQIMEENELHFLPSGYHAVLKAHLVKYDFSTRAIASASSFFLRVEYRYLDGYLSILSMNTISEEEYKRTVESLKN